MFSIVSNCSSAGISSKLVSSGRFTTLAVADYDLAGTLTSGQSFRWEFWNGGWEGVIGERWVRLVAAPERICAATAVDQQDWTWLTHYLQTDVELGAVLAQFPDDAPMRQAVDQCRGLRLLRQEPWECLTSFILSSTKQIIQIQQIVKLLSARFGTALTVPEGHSPAHAFPCPARLAEVSEAELRACKMGFRAPYLKAAAAAVVEGGLDLHGLAHLGSDQARDRLLELPGVGPKIANCVLLFAYGFPDAFPVDVWVTKALKELYFNNRHVSAQQLRHFSQTHFGAYAGYAQQYLFHHMRTRPRAGLVAAARTRSAHS